MGKIIKAEILWTRICGNKCHYCKMYGDQVNTRSLAFWENGITNLKSLDANFIAFYGAEPLLDFYNLPETVGFAEKLGINTTVITSGCVPYFHDKLRALYNHGARSLTMSYDMVALDNYSQVKSSKAIDGLSYFQSLGSNVRDVAVVATLTRKNFKLLPETIKVMNDRNIWTFFDIIHPDRNQPGSKVSSSPELLFQPEDYEALREVLDLVMDMKSNGYRCHSSVSFTNKVKANDFDLIRNYNWNCSSYPEFPSWVTVDCDGQVFCCDDFQMRGKKAFYLDELANQFDEFSLYWKNKAHRNCPGCCWNTHIDAHEIKAGQLKITDYVHGLEN